LECNYHSKMDGHYFHIDQAKRTKLSADLTSANNLFSELDSSIQRETLRKANGQQISIIH
jgi:hypothetical protein